jgi:signal transduction histidine kinase
VFSIILTFISAWVYAGRALRPITNVIDQVNEIGAGSLNLRVDEGNGNDEIAKLSLTFNNMLCRLEKSFKLQENFFANASHELRTPLAAIYGQIEVVLMKDRPGEEYKKVMQSMMEEINNLIVISNRLLMLAQASSENIITDFRPVRIDEIIWQSKSELQKHHPRYQIPIHISSEIDEEAKFLVSGNEQLMKAAVMNLMDNGCKYSPDHQVQVTIDRENENLSISFQDNGIGIPEYDHANILEPFYRGRNASHVKGHGIGLSLVDLIVRLHGGTFSFTSVVDQGSTFKILFQDRT